jgi:hypothetical protein
MPFTEFMLLIFVAPALGAMLYRYRVTADSRSLGIGLLMLGLSLLVVFRLHD